MRIHSGPGDGIVYLGINGEGEQAGREARALARASPAATTVIGHAEHDRRLGADHFRLADGRVVDLANADGAVDFVMSLELDEDTSCEVLLVLLAAPAGGRDELAELATLFADAEHGHPIPRRLVLSGHSDGLFLYDGAGRLGAVRLSDVAALAAALPRGAAQIEDLMLSACHSGFDRARAGLAFPIDAWQTVFPNLRTVWAYGGLRDAHSPTGDGALAHLRAWELATRGSTTSLDANAALRRVVGGVAAGFAASVTTWSAEPVPPPRRPR